MSRLGDWRDTNELVYQPAEDSQLLLTHLRDRIDPEARLLDVGTGSGYIAAKLRDDPGATVVGVDVNPHACRQAAATGVPVVRGDLVAPFATASFDVLVCNPPYLPTTPDVARGDWMEHALDGGPSGRRVTNRLLDSAASVLRPGGRVYLLVSSLQDIDRVRDRAESNGFAVTELGRDDSFPFETLSVLELTTG